MSKILNQLVFKYNSEKNTVERIRILSDIVNLYFDSNFELINPFLQKELKEFEATQNINGATLIRYMLAYAMFERGDFKNGQVEFNKVMEAFPLLTENIVKAQINNFLAFINSHQGNFDKAFYYVYECIKLSDASDDYRNKYWGQYTLGVFYFDLKDFENSEKNYLISYEGFKKYNNAYGVARSETGLASIYIQKEQYTKAAELLQHTLEFYNEYEIHTGQSRSLNDLGVIFKKTGQYDKALMYLKEALKVREITYHAQGIATTLNEIGEVYLLMQDYKNAEEYLSKAKLACEKIQNKSKLYRTHLLFTQLYKQSNEPWKALEHYELYDKLKTEVVGETANNKIKELQTKMATEKADKEAEIERLRNVELKAAYTIIEEKNKEITDSIRYAKRLQEAILPPMALIQKHLPNTFVLYKPKDIVAGDFYWMEVLDNTIFIAAADCTGHGVPGALVSVVCSNALNRAVKEFKITEPGKILDKVRELVIETFSKSESEVKDGMDISLCSIHKLTNEVKWAGAHNPLWYISNGELKEIKGDKQPIGVYEHANLFTTHSIDVKSVDVLYLFTDGYADQFGGPKGKKYLYKRLQESLEIIHSKSIQEQCTHLEAGFNQWKGSLEQVDDVCMIGIKL